MKCNNFYHSRICKPPMKNIWNPFARDHYKMMGPLHNIQGFSCHMFPLVSCSFRVHHCPHIPYMNKWQALTKIQENKFFESYNLLPIKNYCNILIIAILAHTADMQVKRIDFDDAFEFLNPQNITLFV